MAAAVVRTSVPASTLTPGITVREMLNDADQSHRLHQRTLHLAGTAALDSAASGNGEAWYISGGTGQLRTPGGQVTALRPGTAVWLPAQTPYALTGEDLGVVAVIVRAGTAADERQRVVRLEECEPERTGDREFRVLLSEGLSITQFVGLIPPGRAPEHQHTYDEIVHVLAGVGVVHLATADARTTADSPIGPGASIYLPPGQPHCLENTGTGPLRVLGNFSPAGSPAAKTPAP
jgi:mannose-6-phosphate isomerase-like protein (cupin superfamily)